MQMTQGHTIITTHQSIEGGPGSMNGDQAELSGERIVRQLLGSFFILCVTLLGAVQVGAHSAKHAEPVKSLHGGQSLAAGPYHLELVTKDGELLLYVNDHSDKPIPTEGAKAKATIQQGFENTNEQVELAPAGENTLKGTGTFALSPETGIIVFLKLPQRDAHAARFTPLKATSGDAHTDEHQKRRH